MPTWELHHARQTLEHSQHSPSCSALSSSRSLFCSPLKPIHLPFRYHHSPLVAPHPLSFPPPCHPCPAFTLLTLASSVCILSAPPALPVPSLPDCTACPFHPAHAHLVCAHSSMPLGTPLPACFVVPCLRALWYHACVLCGTMPACFLAPCLRALWYHACVLFGTMLACFVVPCLRALWYHAACLLGGGTPQGGYGLSYLTNDTAPPDMLHGTTPVVLPFMVSRHGITTWYHGMVSQHCLSWYHDIARIARPGGATPVLLMNQQAC